MLCNLEREKIFYDSRLRKNNDKGYNYDARKGLI